MNHDKDNVEIVNWHYLDDKTLKQKENQAQREGGLILTLDNVVGDTSSTLVSAGKGSELGGEKQGEGGEKRKGEPEADATGKVAHGREGTGGGRRLARSSKLI